MIDPNHNFFVRIQNSKNFVIVKDDIGKPKPVTRKLPKEDFTFGKKTVRDIETAGDLIFTWNEHRKSLKTPCEKDYRHMNILSLASKKTRASEVREFRKNHSDIVSKLKKNRYTTPDIRFGVAVRPSTPMRAVLNNFYGQLATEKKHKQYAIEASKISQNLVRDYRKNSADFGSTGTPHRRFRKLSVG